MPKWFKTPENIVELEIEQTQQELEEEIPLLLESIENSGGVESGMGEDRTIEVYGNNSDQTDEIETDATPVVYDNYSDQTDGTASFDSEEPTGVATDYVNENNPKMHCTVDESKVRQSRFGRFYKTTQRFTPTSQTQVDLYNSEYFVNKNVNKVSRKVIDRDGDKEGGDRKSVV